MKKELKIVAIDFEYNDTAESKLNLVSCALAFPDGATESFWLHKNIPNQDLLIDRIARLHNEGYTFLAYNVIAEARSFLALGLLDVYRIRWYDLYLEWLCLTNHNHSMAYGKQYLKGRIRTTKPPKPKWEQSEEDSKKANSSKRGTGLGACLFKLLGVQIDNVFKEETRQLIISKPDEFSESEKGQILAYGESDVKYLIPAFMKAIEEYKRLLKKDFNASELKKEMLYRAEYSARTAMMESLGYPVNIDKMRRFSDAVEAILWECQKDINDQFPDTPPFRRNSANRLLMSMHQQVVKDKVKEWLKANKGKNWIMTKGGDISLSGEAFGRHFSYHHTYPRNNFFAQIVRYLNLKKSLNGFSPTSETTIWDRVGSDGRVRPYFNIYGSQSGRSQPKATSFIPLKSAWMRCLIEPPPGKCIVGIDWASEEFMLSGLEYQDEAMMKTYESGDVYLGFLQEAKQVPMDATKETHKLERQEAKPVVLGLTYDMTEYGLATGLTNSWGREVSVSEALKWVNRYKRTYRTMYREKAKRLRQYRRKKYLKLPDGWYLWGDNNNERSVGNFPIQGLGSAVMRKAVQYAQNDKLNVIYTLHDAIYIECDIEDRMIEAKFLAEAMDRAVRYFFKNCVDRATIRLDCDIWSPELEEEEGLIYYAGDLKMPWSQSTIYIDERGVSEYEKFKQYLEPVKVEGEVEF